MLVIGHPELEHWLAGCSSTFRLLSDREYHAAVREWREAFAHRLAATPHHGDAAADQLDLRLPATVFLFNGLAVAQVSSGSTSKPSAYAVAELAELQPQLVNQGDFILVDTSFTFTYVGTHEWQALGKPRFIGPAV